ncbi:MAG: alpha-L-fucosidase [Verrucomicrobia bacterium]|nr:alpha-L-fucosidase [Verrucomicrobiota bacterium]MCH8527010.1 alpha-L-fucosidase [Kiritimatiellia bacterium]
MSTLFAAEPRHQNDLTDSLAWWREARFGMFIHWGIYSATEGCWNGVESKGIGEWIQSREQIPLKEYATFAEKLTLEAFDAREYAALAKKAGMKYVVITAKHHDGFAMWDSKVSEYNIVKRGPAGRDPLRELADAVRAEGLVLGIYYSQAHDWEDPDAVGNTWDYDPKDKIMDRFIEGKCKGQLRELLTEYGEVGLIWFDVPQEITKEQSLNLKRFVKSIQPQCLVSGRIGHGLGDYGSLGDNQLPAGRVTGDWETPVTLNDTWGYKRDDQNWKSSGTLIRQLVELLSKGANYLLNVGPRADGSIPEESVKILKEVGDWMEIHREAVYGTSPSPFPTHFKWGRAAAKKNLLYLFLFEAKDTLEIAGLRSRTVCASLLSRDAGLKSVEFTQAHETDTDKHLLSIRLSPESFTPPVSVIRLELEGSPDVISIPCQQPDNSIHLPAYLSEVRIGKGCGNTSETSEEDTAVAAEAHNLQAERGIGVDVSGVIQNWFDTESAVHWDFILHTPGTYQIELLTLAAKYKPWVGGHKVAVEVPGQITPATLHADFKPDIPGHDYFSETGSRIGTVELLSPGTVRITLKAEHINPADPAGLAVSGMILRRVP